MTPETTQPLLSFLQQEAQNARDTALEEQRAAALSFYVGDPFGDEVEGRSQLVTRDVAEVIDYMTVSILRTVVSGDRIVQFEARNQNDTQAADDASEAIQYAFMRQQDGYRTISDWLKGGLLEKTSAVKSWVQRDTKPETFEVPAEAFEEGPDGLTLNGLPVVGEPEQIAGGDVVGADALTGEPIMSPVVYRATVRQPLPPKFLDVVVPNEEFGVCADARDLDTAAYLFHATPKSLSDLRSMGFEFEDDKLWGENEDARIVSDARDSQRSRRDTDAYRDGPLRRVWLREEYCLYDLNGDGIAERLCVHRVGGTILKVAEVDDQPFEEWCPFPATSRRVGQSLADKTMDIQKVRSVLLRQGMDSLYLSTNPRTLLHEGSEGDNTIDDLLTVRSGGLIRWTGTVPPTPFAVQPVHDQAFQGMELMVGERESRTGITRLNQGLDADTLNKTATGTALMQAQGQQIEEYLARNFVEAVARLFAKKYRYMRQFGEPFMIQVDGTFRQVDPRSWPEEMDVRVRVGLGSGRKDQRIQYNQMLLTTQMEAMDREAPIVTWGNIYATASQLVSDMGIGNVSDRLTRPPEQDQQQQGEKPDPEAIKAQAEAGKMQAEMQLKAQSQMASAQGEAELRQARIQQMALDAEAERQLKRDRAEMEARLAQDKQAFEMQQAIERAAFDMELKRMTREAAGEQESGLPAYRPGGDLAQ